MPDIWAGVPWLGASHSVRMAGILARFGRIDRRARMPAMLTLWEAPSYEAIAQMSGMQAR